MASSKKPRSVKSTLPRKIQTFERVVLWIYSGSILEKAETCVSLGYAELLKIYVFAEARCITHLQNDTIDVIIRKEEKTGVIMVPGAEVDMYASTTDSSPIRRLAVNMAAYNVASGRVEWELTNWPKQYLIDLALAFWRSKANGYWAEKKDFWAQRCDYHVHTTTEPQCANVPNPG